jgi:hypothetical protein
MVGESLSVIPRPMATKAAANNAQTASAPLGRRIDSWARRITPEASRAELARTSAIATACDQGFSRMVW